MPKKKNYKNIKYIYTYKFKIELMTISIYHNLF